MRDFDDLVCMCREYLRVKMCGRKRERKRVKERESVCVCVLCLRERLFMFLSESCARVCMGERE